ncbi:MAG TPA: carbonic anhydrase [Thermoanaerobaculaceae bacterium]|nr:carbonic anhydrase [Thermoanaerobaculaceae bacterium]HRS14841.1 carbonic anhydrase [Thermoanaerobaculaceae bacterium]
MDELVIRTRKVRAACLARDAALMAELPKGQRPAVLYIGCADSRVMPSRILDPTPGAVFVTRNIANIVPPHSAAEQGETSLAAVLEYALAHLHVSDIVVCGHSCCGGMQALAHVEMLEPTLRRWLQYAQDAQARVPAKATGAARLDALIEANVVLQLEHLRSHPLVADAERAGSVRLHGWVFDIASGRVRALDAATGRFVEEAPFEP